MSSRASRSTQPRLAGSTTCCMSRRVAEARLGKKIITTYLKNPIVTTFEVLQINLTLDYLAPENTSELPWHRPRTPHSTIVRGRWPV
jgi:hypothetical protein